MRKILLISFLFIVRSSFSQILNSGFENWTFTTDSFGFSTYIPTDTFSYLKLDNWTSSNSLTGNPASGGKYLVNQSTDPYSGTLAVQMNTDSIFIGGALNQGLIVPGFIVNGNFKFDLASILFSSSGQVDPQHLAGAGSAISSRIDRLGLHVKYNPIAGDSLLVWAVLKKAGSKVAECKFYSTQASSSYHYIEGSFTYFSCDIPDSVVVMIASSNPDFSSLLSGTSGLNPGSVLIADSLSLIPFAAGASRPVVQNYSTYTFTDHSKRLTVSASDSDCTGHLLTFALAGSPAHGTVSISGDTVTYDPAPGFSGADTIYYTASNGSYTSTGYVIMDVFVNSGVAGIGSEQLQIYPNPANNTLMIRTPLTDQATAVVCDIWGQRVMEQCISSAETSINISSLSPGTYFLSVRSALTHSILKFIKE